MIFYKKKMITSIYDIKILTILIWVAAFLVNFALNPVHAALYLIFTFILSSLLLFNLGLILISYMYIIVYVGAIAILFLFIVMLLDLKNSDLTKGKDSIWYKLHIFSLFFIYYQFFKILVLEYYISSLNFTQNLENNIPSLYSENLSSVLITDLFKFGSKSLTSGNLAFDINKVLGYYLYNENGILILILGILLFISMVLAIYLVKPTKKK